MKYYLKKALFIIVYLLFAGIIANGALNIEGHWIFRLGLLIVNLALFLYISCGITYQDGQKAYKKLIANDSEREYMVKTGEIREIDTVDEYHWSKGFIIGACACVPLVILIILHALISTPIPETAWAGNLVTFIYMLVFGFFNVDFASVQSEIVYASPYLVLLAIPVIAISQGIAYYLGARSIRLQQDKIKRTHQSIYGE